MKRLQDMDDEIKRQRCHKCDFLNHKVPISKKRTNCTGMDNILECEAFMATQKLKNRIDYITGKSGPMFVCSNIHDDGD